MFGLKASTIVFTTILPWNFPASLSLHADISYYYICSWPDPSLTLFYWAASPKPEIHIHKNGEGAGGGGVTLLYHSGDTVLYRIKFFS